ncbi:MAG: hypothetical protein Lokiarch_16440 [Candidatus Lokiarchaeum sp. GC14_75]|nr:MAG: hypothetical protein Lokiarch_16440 [Candidatus Lokiarchaeum sp. GC14_75]
MLNQFTLEFVSEYFYDSIFSFFPGKSKSEIENLIIQYSSDYKIINHFLSIKYPGDQYFFILDLEKENNRSFRVRIWEKKASITSPISLFKEKKEKEVSTQLNYRPEYNYKLIPNLSQFEKRLASLEFVRYIEHPSRFFRFGL